MAKPKNHTLNKKVFSSYKGPEFKSSDFVQIQYNSFDWFLKKGLKELFDEISPITDHTGEELELHFLDYKFDDPKYTEEETREKDQTYEASLRADLKLLNKNTKKEKKQEVYLGDFPIMTDKGTFIINGVERVIISQLIRSPGVYFSGRVYRGNKFFGAKIIPNRGSWLEFETETNGMIGVKIDRKRKAPFTYLLKIFGFETNQEIIEAFKGVDDGDVSFIESTLKKDNAKSVDDAYVEIYKRLRPGDASSPENAKSLINPMFKDGDRYDLGDVGRYKFNQRLEIEDRKDGVLTKEDLVEVIKGIIKLNNDPDGEPDDIDHLGNRRIRGVGELIQSRLRIGFARLRRSVQDSMSTIDRDNLQPTNLINYKILTSVVRSFFASSQLSQFMDQDNPLAELEHKRKLSAMGPGGLTKERAGFEVRDVHSSYYGRICPIKTPEGGNIGLVNSLANYTRVNDLGFLESPYFKIKKSLVTEEVVWLDAVEEEKYNIAQSDLELDNKNKIKDKEVPARIKGKPGECDVKDLDFIDVAPDQIISVSTSLIPFLEHDDAARALMGANMQGQAVPSITPRAPLVGTGQEEKVVKDSKQSVFSEVSGTVESVEGDKIIIKASGKKHEYPLIKFRRSNNSTCISQRAMVKPGDKIKKGDLLADGSSADNGVLALGQNLLVAFMPWQGTNFEDAILVSERVARDDMFTSIHIETHTCSVRDTKLGPEITTPDIPNVSEDKLRNLDEDGIIRIGAEVKSNDILVGKITPKGESELTPEEKLLRAIFGEKASNIKDSSLTLPHGKQARVIGIKIFSREKGDKLEPGIIKKIQIEVAQLRKIKAGDKLAGRHGNKGVISQIRPVEDMPFLENGRPVDIVLNPLGVVSRMNLGQILETHLGLAADALGYRAVVPNFVGLNGEDVKEELKKAGFPENGKLNLVNGLTGEKFEKPVVVGYIYMLKLHHLIQDKIHMRSTGPYSLITQQPLGGKAQLGGQRFGEMEVWALEGYGAAHTLQEMLTIKSDDIIGRSAAFESIIRGQKIKKPTLPASFNLLVNEMKAIGLNVGFGKDPNEEDIEENLNENDDE
ncbi:MAG: DNA-directed RNA polymerase subunit beta [Candidatus Paceibacterota bacterium]